MNTSSGTRRICSISPGVRNTSFPITMPVTVCLAVRRGSPAFDAGGAPPPSQGRFGVGLGHS